MWALNVEESVADLNRVVVRNDGILHGLLAQRELFEFIEIWYNHQRRHSSPGYRSTAEFEEEVLKIS
jgi:transposase InsO family protein